MINHVISTFSKIMDIDINEISIETTTEDIKQWDSLHHMELILALEEEFSIQFDDEDISEMISIRLIIEHLEKLLNH